VVSLIGFDVSLAPNGVFVGTEINLETVGSLGPELIHTVGSEVADLTHFLQSPLPGIDALPDLGSAGDAVASTLGEVTGLEVLGITTKSITDALLPSQPHDADPVVAPLVDLPLTNVLNILPLTDAGIVSSGSIPIVAGSNHLDQSDQLYAAGGHTEYGVTLQLNSVTTDAAQGSANLIPAAVDVAGAVVDVPHDVAADPASQALHLDELNLRSLSI